MNNTPSTRVAVTPGVGTLALLPSMNDKPQYAIGEFVDNATLSWHANSLELEGAEGAQHTLHIDIDRNLGTIAVTDNAASIAARDIPRDWPLGDSPAWRGTGCRGRL